MLAVGEFAGSTALARTLIRQLRARQVSGAHRATWVFATADFKPRIVSALAAGADLTVPREASVTHLATVAAALARPAPLATAADPHRRA